MDVYLWFILKQGGTKIMAKTKKLTNAQMEARITRQNNQLIRLKAERRARETLINDGWAPKT